MKKMIFTLIALLTMSVAANAMSYEQARNEALFLTDKMAYELDLTDEQYEAAYEINLDYLMGVTSPNDVYGIYWERRNLDLSYILYSWQWDLFRAAEYFFRPLYWRSGRWHFGIYARYTVRDYFYFGRPAFYVSYRGGHAWHVNGGRSYYYGRRDHFRPAVNHRHEHFGMRQRYDCHNNGNYRNHQSLGRDNNRPRLGNNRSNERPRLGTNDRPRTSSSTRITAGNRTNTDVNIYNDNRTYNNNTGNRNFNGNRERSIDENRPTTSSHLSGTTPNRSFGSNRTTTTTTPNRSFGSDRPTTTTSRPTTTTTPSTPTRHFGGNSSSTPSRSTSTPSRSFGSSSGSSRSFGSSSSSTRNFGSSSSSTRSAGASSGNRGHFGGRR